MGLDLDPEVVPFARLVVRARHRGQDRPFKQGRPKESGQPQGAVSWVEPVMPVAAGGVEDEPGRPGFVFEFHVNRDLKGLPGLFGCGETDHSASKSGSGAAGNESACSLAPTASGGGHLPYPFVEGAYSKPALDAHGVRVCQQALQGIGGDGKAEALGGLDRDDADDPATLIDQGAAAVAGFNRHGDLDHVAPLELALFSDHPPGDAIVQAKRVSDGKDLLAGSYHA